MDGTKVMMQRHQYAFFAAYNFEPIKHRLFYKHNVYYTCTFSGLLTHSKYFHAVPSCFEVGCQYAEERITLCRRATHTQSGYTDQLRN
jgi:hypothetical protein